MLDSRANSYRLIVVVSRFRYNYFSCIWYISFPGITKTFTETELKSKQDEKKNLKKGGKKE